MLDEVKEVLDVIARNDMVLAAGHLHVSEIWLVFEEAKRRGVNRLVVNHPEEIIDATHERRAGARRDGCQYGALALHVPRRNRSSRSAPSEDLQKHIDAAGIDNTIMCSDLGQIGNIGPIEGIRRGIELCLDLGYSAEDIRKMVSLNAAKLFGLEKLLPTSRPRIALAIRGAATAGN